MWDVATNQTSNRNFNSLYVVGVFDTVSETSQTQYCSVGQWNGQNFDKVRRIYFYVQEPASFTFSVTQVGEGLCPRGSDSSNTVQLETIVLGNNDDLFVGGSFESRVWDGRHFVRILHIAQFDSKSI